MATHRRRAVPLVLLAAPLLAACSAPGRLVIKVGEAELQRKVSERFPIAREALLLRVAIESPRVHLNPRTDRVELDLWVTAAVAGQEVARASARVSGGVRYLEEGTVFVLTDPRVERFDASRVPHRFEEQLRGVLNGVVSEALPAIPLHRLREDQRVARALLRRAWIEDGVLHLELGLAP